MNNTLTLKDKSPDGDAQGVAQGLSPAERAAKRAAELREHWGADFSANSDRFWFDPKIVPDGWAYEYRMLTVLGKEDPSYQVELAHAGWEPVPASRHRELMPKGYTGQTIIKDGMQLMERPAVIVEAAKTRDYKTATQQVRDKEAQLSGTTAPGQFERKKADGSPFVSINKTTVPIAVPK
jgi:hypothetical protein